MPAGIIDPDDEIVNLILDDDEDNVVTVQSDEDGEETEELVFTYPTDVSGDDSSQIDTRSEEENTGVEISEQVRRMRLSGSPIRRLKKLEPRVAQPRQFNPDLGLWTNNNFLRH